MRPLRYTINVTADGCCAADAGIMHPELHAFHERNLASMDAMLCGRVIYGMMESAWRAPGETGVKPDWMEPWMMPFAATITATKKYVVSSTLTDVTWNAELLQGDLATAVRRLKSEPGRGLLVSGVTLPLALARLGLIDEYEFVVHPRIAGRGPYLLAGLTPSVDLALVDQRVLQCGAVVMRYTPHR